MKIISYTDEYKDHFLKLQNEVLKETILLPTCENEFDELIKNNQYFSKKLFLLALENREIIGATLGFIKEKTGYISFVMVKRNFRRKGIGTSLLKALETQILKLTSDIKIYYHAPFNFSWLNNGYYHPGAPAVIKDSPYEKFLIKNGYEAIGTINGYYLNLEDYHVLDDIRDDDIKITIYDEKIHKGLLDIFIENCDFKKTVINNLKKEKPLPMIVAVSGSTVVGWTGPMSLDHHGRGVFGGITVKSTFRQKGIGTSLFKHLVNYFKTHGASFMTLFTGEENKARFIYEKVGFKIGTSFSILIKKKENK